VTQGALIGGLILARARQRRAEAEARRQRDDLAHVLRVTTLSEMTSSLAHEILQPIAAILTNASVASALLREARLREPAQHLTHPIWGGQLRRLTCRCEFFGAVAQLGEHLLCKQGVTGSIPVRSTYSSRLPLTTRNDMATSLSGWWPFSSL
jgi:signal transduction histidine kinase